MILKRQKDPQQGSFQKHQHKHELNVRLFLTTQQQQIAPAHVMPRGESAPGEAEMQIPGRLCIPAQDASLQHSKGDEDAHFVIKI